MKIFGIYIGKEKKSLTSEVNETLRVAGQNDGAIYFGDSLEHILTPRASYLLYEKVSVIFDAVDKIASRVASLNLILKDQNENIIKDSPIIKLLEKPDRLKGKTGFWNDMATSWKLTNHIWIVVRGNVLNEPLAIDFIEPYYVSESSKSSNEQMPSVITTDSPKDKRQYYKETIDGIDRWFSKDRLNELIPIIGKTYSNDWRGMSPLSPLIEEVTHIKEGNRHNRGLLKNGMTSSSVFSPEGHEVDEDAGKELASMLARHHSGAGNAGRPLILPNAFKLIDKSTTNKDMDYMKLIDTDESRVFRLYNIPLPLVKSQTMTQSNYESAIPFLYSDAVIPTFNQIAEELTNKLLPRFKVKKGEYLTFNEFDIPALNGYQVRMMSEMIKTNAVTINEIRQRGGYEKVDNGNDVMISAGLVKLGDNMDMFSE